MSIVSLLLPDSYRKKMNDWIASRNPPTDSQIELHQRRVYILPTRFGYIYALMLIVLFLAAINYENSMAYVLTFLLTALGIISLWQTHKNLLGLIIELKSPPPVFLGEPLQMTFTLNNPNQSERYAIGIQYANQPPVYTGLSPAQDVNCRLPLPSVKRGLYKTGGFTIFTRYPTGLFHAWGWLHFEVPVLIYPKPLYDIELTDSLIDQHSGKNTIDTADGDDFAGLREHQPGESLRHISWKAYAQGRGMLTKTFQGHASPSLWVDWFHMSAKSTEGKLSQMTALVLQAHQQGRKFGLRLPGIEIPLDNSPSHRAECLQQISTYQQADINSRLEVNESESAN